MIIAVITMRVVQVAIDQIIHMITMGHCFMAAIWSMDMALGMAFCRGGAAVGVSRVNGDYMLVHVVMVRVVQMTIVQVIDMAIVFDSCVAATRPMFMVVPFMGNAAGLWVVLHAEKLHTERSGLKQPQCFNLHQTCV
jgi:hypothetical protein